MAAALLLGGNVSASAATRHAEAGANGPEPCASAAPCSLFGAIHGATAGDEVIVAPGAYSDTAGDLGGAAVHSIFLPASVTVHGEAGAPRPRIAIEEKFKWLGTVFYVESGDLLAHLEITTTGPAGVFETDGTTEDLIVRSTTNEQHTACFVTGGVMRDSACLSSAPNAGALGGSLGSLGPLAVTLRNVTAISTGAGGVGISYEVLDGGELTVDAKSVIARGSATGVRAEGLSTFGAPGTGGSITIDIDHSDVSGTPETVTDSGEGTATINSTNSFDAVPLLAADGYHQLPGSPTVDAGAFDVQSGLTDVDGQDRPIGSASDIGADELGVQTVLSLACSPPAVVLADAPPGPGSECVATVTDEAESGLLPFGTVSFASSGGGDLSASSCALGEVGATRHTSCGVTYTPRPGSAGAHTISAVFAGDSVHDGSEGSAVVTVREKPPIACAGSTPGCGGPIVVPSRPAITLGLRPPKKTGKRQAKFTFSSDAGEARFECKLDRQKFRPCRSPFRHAVSPGRHRFAVRAVSGGGTSDPATYAWRVLSPGPR